MQRITNGSAGFAPPGGAVRQIPVPLVPPAPALATPALTAVGNSVLKAMYDAGIDAHNAGDSSLNGGVVAIYTGSSLALTEVTRVWIQSGRPGGVLVDVQTRVLLDAVETYAQQFDPGGIIIESVSEYKFYDKSQLSSEC